MCRILIASRRVSVLQWGDPTPRGSSVARTITPAPGLLLPPGGLPASGSDQLRAEVRAVHASECIARSDVTSDHTLIASLDGLMPCDILKLIAAAIASQLVILPSYFGKFICSAPSPRLFNYPFSFPDHIVGIICLVTFGVFSQRSEFFLIERQRRFGEL
jgi:hypothetical protein